MKRVTLVAIIMVIILGLVGCGSPPVDEAPQAGPSCSVDGLTVSIEELHLTSDSNGNDIAALECKFVNENTEPVSFNSGIVLITAYQDSAELTADNMYLNDDYNWSSTETSIKDGAEISVFEAIPLSNTISSVEIKITLYSIDGEQHAEATRTFSLTE